MFAAVPFPRMSFFLKRAGNVLLPMAVAGVPVAAWLGGVEHMGAAALHGTHLACLAAALLAFWHRFRASRFLLSDQICGALWLLWLGWIFLGLSFGDAPAVVFPHVVAVFSAVFLLYAARRSALFQPRLTLFFLVCGQALLLVAEMMRGGWRLEISPWVLSASSTVFAGMVVLPFTLRRNWQGWQWGVAAVWLGLFFFAAWGVRGALSRSFTPDTGPRLIPSRYASASALVRREFRSRLFTGMGLGGFENRLRAAGGDIRQVEAMPALVSFFPEREAQILRDSAVVRPAPGSPGATAPRIRWGMAPGAVSSFPAFAVELGLPGSGIAMACLLFLAAYAVYAISTARRSSTSLLTLGVLILWLGLLAEGAAGPVLRQRYGLLLFALLSGLLWGLSRSLREDHPPAMPPVPPAWKGLLAFSVIVAAGLALVTAFPLKGQSLLAEAQRADAASVETEKIIALLERARGFDPASSDIPLFLAEQYRRLPAKEGYHPALDAYYAARKRNPYREEIYAAQARFHRDENEEFLMREAIEAGRARCPNSILLAAWRIENARMAQDSGRLETALREAIRIPGQEPSLRLRFQEDLGRLFERQNRYADALEAYCRRFQLGPGDLDIRRSIERAAAAVFHQIPKASPPE